MGVPAVGLGQSLPPTAVIPPRPQEEDRDQEARITREAVNAPRETAERPPESRESRDAESEGERQAGSDSSRGSRVDILA